MAVAELPIIIEPLEEQCSLLKDEVARLQAEVQALSLYDPVTGLAGRRLMDFLLGKSLAIAQRYGNALSLLRLDIDAFEQYNTTYSASAGDRLLVVLGKMLLEEIRNTDLAAHFNQDRADADLVVAARDGGFLILLHETNYSGACNIAERIRKTVKECVGVTLSIGGVTWHKGIKNTTALVEQADIALSQAKQKGGDRVEVFSG